MYKKRRAAALLLCLFCLSMLFSGCERQKKQGPEIILRYAECAKADEPRAMAALEFSRLVEEKSGGRIAIRVYLDGELGTEYTAAEQVLLGGIDFADVDTEILQDGVTELAALAQPYIFRDEEKMWAALDGKVGQEYLETISDHGLVGLAFLDGGTNDICTRKQKLSPFDLKGTSIAAEPNTDFYEIVVGMQAKPMEIETAEMATMLSQGTIEGCETNIYDYYYRGIYREAPYVMETAHSRNLQVMIAAPFTLQNLQPEDKQLIFDCAKEAGLYQRKLWNEEIEVIRGILRESRNSVLTQLEPEVLVEFQKAMQPIYDSLSEDQKWNMQEILDLQEEK